ncbi:hypothetical protein [Variovorax sp. LG9.2]|uniref:phage tail fiber protein n=1 Tax=Variovorax sp. LG9.2 TaxID=3048626 RepID=UPI002B2274FB|nr:hypothetical protein [Variovorax sp. LG9.2]MEB0057305.1 hypothetical protein [Variovorax sp. LG9.2]
MPYTYFVTNKANDAALGKTTFTATTAVYLALSTTTPTAGTGASATEPAGSAYARVAVPAASWNTTANGTTTNNAAIAFPAATGAWGTVTYAVGYDAASAGNVLFYVALTASQAITTGMTYSFPAGSAIHTLT